MGSTSNGWERNGHCSHETHRCSDCLVFPHGLPTRVDRAWGITNIAAAIIFGIVTGIVFGAIVGTIIGSVIVSVI